MAYHKITRLRAVFYARVSTEKEAQENALVRQIAECRDTIKNMGWELVDEYIDDGISGTQTRKRDEYRRLFDDMAEGKFDVIVIKAQERLMRNTKDWYIFVDRLVTNDIKLYMYLENSYYTTDNSLITGIKAIMAEEYSRDLSKKLNNSNKRRIERAKKGEDFNCMGSGQTYGFYIVKGQWYIDEEQAKIVKEVFDAYDRLGSLTKTRDYLNEKGYVNQDGRHFVPDTIRRILRNEMQKGVLVLNRNYRDFDKKKILTRPKEEWVYVYDKVPAIVDTELWDRVNAKLDSKINNQGRGKNNSTYPFSSKIYCKHCGSPLWVRNTRMKNANGEQTIFLHWRCSAYLQRGLKGCDNPTSISDIQMRKEYVNIFSEVTANKKEVKATMIKWLNDLKNRLNKVEASKTTLAEIERLKKRKNKLTEAYMDEIISKEDYKIKYTEIESRLEELNATINPSENEDDIIAIDNILENIDSEIDKYVSTQNFEESKIEWFIDHTKKVVVEKTGEGREPQKKLYIELDMVAGAIMGSSEIICL